MRVVWFVFVAYRIAYTTLYNKSYFSKNKLDLWSGEQFKIGPFFLKHPVSFPRTQWRNAQLGHRINNPKITSSAQKSSELRHRFKYVPHSLVSVDAAGARIPVLIS